VNAIEDSVMLDLENGSDGLGFNMMFEMENIFRDMNLNDMVKFVFIFYLF
jgi:hypothetical protein